MVRADPSRDYYGDLELPPTADVNDIKKQFKKLALKYHPDRNIGRENEVNAKFQAIQSAHEVLTDSEQRAKYDASRKRGMAYASGFGASTPTPRGNPYANAGSQWAPPPKRNPNPNRPPPPSAGAQRYKNFETPGAGASAHKTAQEGAESRRSTYQAWENMRGKPESAKTAYGSRAETGPGKSWATPKAPPKEHTPQSGREESNNMKHSVPPRSKAYEEFMTGSMPRRSQSTKRTGFMPSDPTGDEPQASSKSAYFTSSNRRAEFPNDVPPPPPRPHVVDPLKQFREQAGAPSEPRLSTPYSTHGGEKTNPFESANINRSRSTRDPGSAGAFSPTSSSDRHRSASPPRSRPYRSYPTTDYFPRTDSDPNMARRNNPHAPRQTPVVDLDSTSSEDEARGTTASHQKPREYAKPKKRTTATAKPPPTGTENSKHIPLREFREWWNANQKSHTATDPSLKDFPQGQTTNNANGQPSMYAYSFTANTPEIKPAVKLPKVSEAYSSRDGYLARDKDPYSLTSSSSFFTKWPVPSNDGTDHLGRSDATTPSGASTHALNPFEMKQRNLLDQLVNNPRKGERLCSFTSKRSSSGMASQPAPPQASQNSQHSFSFNTDGTSEKPRMTSFPSSSAENISTKFTPEDWDGKFTAGDYFMNEQKAADMPTPGRARSGSRTRGKSPIKPRAGSRPNLSTKASVPGLDPKPDSEVPLESPGGTRQFSAQEWEQTFAPAVFAPPPHQSPSGRPAYPNRKSSKTQRGSVPRPTAGTAAVIDDSDSSDGKQLFMGRNKFNGNSNSSGTSTRPETRTASPTPMDIDTEEPPRTPSAPRMASSTLRKQGLAAFAKAAAEGQTGQPRNVPLEPSRPEWRDTNSRAEASTAPQPDLPPRATKSPTKRRAAESAGGDGFESINLETLKNAEPIMQGAKGLNGFDDLASNLPFQSQAASKVPIAKSSTTGDLDLPTIPRAPNPVNASQPTSWQAYLSAFNTYMVDWDLFYCRMISHFTARRHQVQQMRQGWLGGVGDEPCLQYVDGLAEDMKVHDWWCTAMEMHKQNFKTFMAMREAAKHHFGVA